MSEVGGIFFFGVDAVLGHEVVRGVAGWGVGLRRGVVSCRALVMTRSLGRKVLGLVRRLSALMYLITVDFHAVFMLSVIVCKI